MVVGHYGCGGVQAVAEKRSTGLADNWLRHIEDIAHKHEMDPESETDGYARVLLL
jgi:carbonic anhydrase